MLTIIVQTKKANIQHYLHTNPGSIYMRCLWFLLFNSFGAIVGFIDLFAIPSKKHIRTMLCFPVQFLSQKIFWKATASWPLWRIKKIWNPWSTSGWINAHQCVTLRVNSMLKNTQRYFCGMDEMPYQGCVEEKEYCRSGNFHCNKCNIK